MSAERIEGFGLRNVGYASECYARSFSGVGQPYRMEGAGAWLLKRLIPDTQNVDAMGCYPVFACGNWQGLEDDLRGELSGLISMALVTDPFGDYSQDLLHTCFPDKMFAYKQHFIIDLHKDWLLAISPAHKRNIEKAERVCSVKLCDDPRKYLDTWISLYDCLIHRHKIKGIAAFTRESFQKQFEVPGLVTFRAEIDGKTAGMLLWYVDGEKAYYHLGAYSEAGYENSVSFALFHCAIRHFAGLGLRFLGLGAGAGVKGDADDGLTRFKRGWANATRTVYFCGRIFDRKRYDELVRQRNIGEATFFPAYRAGEFI